MTQRTADLASEGKWRTRAPRTGFAIAALLLAVGAASRPASAQQAPVPKKPPQLWLQSVERPSRGWDYDGKRILGHVGFKVCLWDATTGKLLEKWTAHKEHIFAVQFSPDGDHALTCSWMDPGPISYKSKDTRTIIWGLKRGDIEVVLSDQVAGEFSPDGKRVVTFTARPGKLSSFDATVWDVATGREVVKVKLDKSGDPRWDTLHFSPDGRRFAHCEHGAFLLYNHGSAVLFDASEGREIGKITARQDGHGHRYTSTGTLASWGEAKATLTDVETGRIVQSAAHDLGTLDCIWTHDGGRVAALRGEKEIRILDLASGKMTKGDKCGPYHFGRAVVSPDNRRLAVGWGGANGVEPGVGLYDHEYGQGDRPNEARRMGTHRRLLTGQ